MSFKSSKAISILLVDVLNLLDTVVANTAVVMVIVLTIALELVLIFLLVVVLFVVFFSVLVVVFGVVLGVVFLVAVVVVVRLVGNGLGFVSNNSSFYVLVENYAIYLPVDPGMIL